MYLIPQDMLDEIEDLKEEIERLKETVEQLEYELAIARNSHEGTL